MERINKIRLLRQTGLPYRDCASWAMTMPESFFEQIASGEPFQGALLSLASVGIVLPCPRCQSPLTVNHAYCGCTVPACGYVAWIALTKPMDEV